MTKGVVYWNDGRPVLVIRGRWLVLGPMTCREDVQAWCGWNRVQFVDGLPGLRQRGALELPPPSHTSSGQCVALRVKSQTLSAEGVSKRGRGMGNSACATVTV